MTKLVQEVRTQYGTMSKLVHVLIDLTEVEKVEAETLPAVRLTFKNGTSFVCLGKPEDFVEKRP